MATRGPQKRVRRRERKNVAHARAHIKASFNNTIINITDQQGNTIVWTSGGSVGFKGSRKSTPYAAQLAAEEAARQAGEHGVRKIEVIISGTGPGKDAWRTLQHMGLEVSGSPRDATPTVHNGCRPKKRRRG